MKNTLFLLLFLSCGILYSQNEPLIKPGRVVFYNVENLFDTINDPTTWDEEFLPDSKREWNTKKYEVKIRHIAKVLGSLFDTIQPLIIGLSEVENEKVLQDLVAQPELQKYNLGIVHHDSPDERGIDVALLYNPQVIGEVFNAFLRIDLGEDKTRDIVYFKAYMDEGAPLWVFVNHWSSRWGGPEKTESKRLVEEKTLKAKIDDLYLGEPDSKVIIMGDFNDNPTNESMTALTTPQKNRLTLINLMKPLYENGNFTLKYKDEKDIFDQFIVSQNLMNPKSEYYVRHQAAYIYSPNWLLFNHPKFGYIPNRTYVGTRWVGGYSDHLPVYFDLVFH